MQIVEKKLAELQPYENNPRKNDNAVEYVAESIKRYGFKQPIVVDKDGVIVAGHTRYLASIELGLDTVPCLVADDLTEEQIKEYRLIDNKVAEYSSWDFNLLEEELDGLDFGAFDFGFPDLSIVNWEPSVIDDDDLDLEEYSDRAEEGMPKRVIIVYHEGEEDLMKQFLALGDDEKLGVTYRLSDLVGEE